MPTRRSVPLGIHYQRKDTRRARFRRMNGDSRIAEIPTPKKVGIALFDLEHANNLTLPLFGRDERRLNLARAMDDSSFDSLWLYDHFLYEGGYGGHPDPEPVMECFVTLGAIAAITQRVRLGHRSVAMHSAVAERVDHSRLAEHCFASRLLEARLVD